MHCAKHDRYHITYKQHYKLHVNRVNWGGITYILYIISKANNKKRCYFIDCALDFTLIIHKTIMCNLSFCVWDFKEISLFINYFSTNRTFGFRIPVLCSVHSIAVRARIMAAWRVSFYKLINMWKLFRNSVGNTSYLLCIVFGCCNYTRYLLYRQESTQCTFFYNSSIPVNVRDRVRKKEKWPVYLFIYTMSARNSCYFVDKSGTCLFFLLFSSEFPFLYFWHVLPEMFTSRPHSPKISHA